MATPKPALLSSEWMDTGETLTALGIKRRTLQEWAQNGFLKFKRETREGRRPERVYSAADVRRIERDGRPASPNARHDAENPRLPAALKREPRRLPPPANTPLVPDKTIALLNQLIENWNASMARPAIAPPPAVPLSQKLWLTLDEAAEYSGLSRGDLTKLCRQSSEGRGQLLAEALAIEERGLPRHALIVRKSGGWKILRKSLEAFEG